MQRARPIGRLPRQPDVPVERRKRPIAGPANEPVLDRIVVDVIQVKAVIAHVADGVLPETFLPHPAVALARAAGCGGRLRAAGGQVALRKPPLDLPDPAGEVAVATRQANHHVQVVGQEDNALDGERAGSADGREGAGQQPAGKAMAEDSSAVVGDHRQKERPAVKLRPSIARHGASLRPASSPRRGFPSTKESPIRSFPRPRGGVGHCRSPTSP